MKKLMKSDPSDRIFHQAAGFASRIGRSIVDKTSDVLAYPKVRKAKKIIEQSTKDFNILRRARNYDNAPDFDEQGQVTDAFKTRSLARDVRKRLEKK